MSARQRMDPGNKHNSLLVIYKEKQNVQGDRFNWKTLFQVKQPDPERQMVRVLHYVKMLA